MAVFSSASGCVAVIALLLISLFVLARCKLHVVNWNLGGVSAYSLDNPLMVRLNDEVQLVCDGANGQFAYSNVVIQPHQSQYEQCNCMTSDLTSCDEANRYGFCAIELPDVVVRISRQSATLEAVFNFEPGKMAYFVSYANNATNAEEAQTQFLMGGDCTKGLKLPVMVEALPTTIPPTTPTTTIDDMGVTGSLSDALPLSSSTTANSGSDGDDNSTSSINPGNSTTNNTGDGNTGGLDSGNLKDWHLAAIGGLVGAFVIFFLIFAVVVVVLCVRRPAARVAPGDSSEGDMPSEKNLDNETVVRNVGAIPSSPTTITYPEDIFKDPLDS